MDRIDPGLCTLHFAHLCMVSAISIGIVTIVILVLG
jgi:hypothetical protein